MLARNLIATWAICMTWDYVLYFSPLAPAFKPYKIIDEYPSLKQVKHDCFWTTIATVTGTMVEWMLCHWYATGFLSFDHRL